MGLWHNLGYGRIVIIGCDCPELQPEEIELAFQELNKHRLILGPDHHGGVYLVGIRASNAWLLQGIRWCEDTDYAQLQARVRSADLCRLPVKHDLDTLDDVRGLAQSSRDWVWVLRLLLSLARSDFCMVPAPLGGFVRAQREGAMALPPPLLS